MVPLDSFRLSGDRVISLLKVVPASACVCVCYVLSGDLNLTSQCQRAREFMVACVRFLNNSAGILSRQVPPLRLVLPACTAV